MLHSQESYVSSALECLAYLFDVPLAVSADVDKNLESVRVTAIFSYLTYFYFMLEVGFQHDKKMLVEKTFALFARNGPNLTFLTFFRLFGLCFPNTAINLYNFWYGN